MKTKFVSSAPQEKLTFPTYRIYNDKGVSNNLFNGSVVLFVDADIMMVVHASPTTLTYKTNQVYRRADKDGFISADDSNFYLVQGSLTLDFN